MTFELGWHSCQPHGGQVDLGLGGKLKHGKPKVWVKACLKHR